MELKDILKKSFQENISDEAITEIETLFESAVNEKVKTEVADKESTLEESNQADIKEFKSQLVEKLSEYVSIAVAEFIEENKVDIHSDVKVKIAEKVMGGLTSLLKDQFVVVPEGETDVVKDLEDKKSDLEGKLNDSMNENIENKNQILEYEKAINFTKLVSKHSLSDSDEEKVLDLLDGIEADSIETFEEKTEIIIGKVKGSKDVQKKEKDKEDLNEKVNDDDSDNPLDEYLDYV